MSSDKQMPPWLQEQITKMQQSQQNLQSILAQKQQVEMENTESDRALEELQKAKDDDHVFLSLIHISEPTRQRLLSYAVF